MKKPRTLDLDHAIDEAIDRPRAFGTRANALDLANALDITRNRTLARALDRAIGKLSRTNVLAIRTATLALCERILEVQ